MAKDTTARDEPKGGGLLRFSRTHRGLAGDGSGLSEPLREVWHSHRRWVAAVILAHKPREADLEDLLQEVAMRLVASPPNEQDVRAIRAWLRTVAINVARTAGRRQTVRKRAMGELQYRAPREAPNEPAGVKSARQEEAARAMRAAFALPEAYREPLLLRAVRGLNYRQIGDALGLPVTTVETRLARARRMLREALNSEGNGAKAAPEVAS